MSQRPAHVLLICLTVIASSCASFSATYAGTGPANKASEFSSRAEKRFSELETLSPADAEAVSKIDIYFDSVPEQLMVDGTTIGIKEGANAELIGSVLVVANWVQHSPADAVPVLQKAAHAAGANLAYCPIAGMGWRCFLVRVAPAAEPASSATTL